MTRAPMLVAGGFLAIGLALAGIAVALGVPALSEARIGRALVENGTPTQALLVSAERLERTRCSRSQRAVCWDAHSLVGTVVYQVDGRRVGVDLRLRPEEFEAHQTGTEVFVDLHYLPEVPAEFEREPGARLASAQGEALNVTVLGVFGLTFALIGGIAALVARKRRPVPSTGPDG